MVSNPRIYTTDSFYYQFVWDDCDDVAKEYELYIYIIEEGNLVCQNLTNPIMITYNQKISLLEIEHHCLSTGFVTPKACKFKIKNSEESLEQVDFFPNTMYYLTARIKDSLCTPSENNTHFHIQSSKSTQDFFKSENSDLAGYELWVKPKDNSLSWFNIDMSQHGPIPQFTFNFTQDCHLKRETQYLGQISYHRRWTTGLSGILSEVDEINTDVTPEVDYMCKCVPVQWDPSSGPHESHIIMVVNNINLLYVSGDISESDTWTMVFGNSIVNPASSTGYVVPEETVTIHKGDTYDVSDYQYVEYYMSTTDQKPTGPWEIERTTASGDKIKVINPIYEKLLNIRLYKQTETQIVNYNSIFEFTTGSYYSHNKTAFYGDYICNDYNSNNYECVYTKRNIADGELYIYQKKMNGTYVLTNNLNYDVLELDREFNLKDPDVDNTMSYQIYCTDTPVLDDNDNILITDITQEQINIAIAGLNSTEYNKISLYKIANYNKNTYEVTGFHENFQWEYMLIKKRSLYDSPCLYVKGTRINEEEMKNTKVTYRLFLENLVDNSFNQVFDLEYKNNGGQWDGYWTLKKDGTWYGADGYILTDLQNKELASRSQYKVTVKAYSANEKRNQVIYSTLLDCQKNIDFLRVPTYTYSPTGSTFIETQEVSCPQDQYVDIDVSKCDEIELGYNRYGTYECIYGQKEKNSNDIFYYKDMSEMMLPAHFGIFQVKDFDVFRIKYLGSSIPLPTSFLNVKKYYKQNGLISYSNQPNNNFGFSIKKDDESSFEHGYPYLLFDNSEDGGGTSYFGYSCNASNINNEQDVGLHNYNHNTDENNNDYNCGVISKISIFPKNSLQTDDEHGENILLTFSITEMIQQNIVVSQTSPEILPNVNILVDINEWTDNKRKIKFISLRDNARVQINFNENVVINSINNLYANCDELIIADGNNNEIYKASNLSNQLVRFKNKKVKTSVLYFYIKNGNIYSDDLKIYTLEQANNNQKGFRNRTFKTENIDLYKQGSPTSIDYNTILNGTRLQGIVLDNSKPVNFYIEDFSDLEDDTRGDLIYKITKNREEYSRPLVFVNDINTVTIQQKNKDNELFNKDFYINSYTNDLNIKNANIKQVTFSQMQKNTLINCILEKEEETTES